MVTTEVFENLKSLQDILVKKYELEKKVSDAPKQLSNQEDLLAKTQKEYIEQKETFDATQATVTELKEKLSEAVKMREEGEKGIANSVTHKEYEALEKQITEAKFQEDDLRKELQQKEKELAGINDDLKTSEDSIKFQQDELNANKDSLNKELDSFNAELKALNSKEEKITNNIKEIYKDEENAELKVQEILFKFQRIIQRNSEGIVSVKNGVCSGCHMILPANFANEVREGADINFCPYCSRILYYEEVNENEEENYFTMGIAGSLAGLNFDDESDEEDEDLNEADEDSDELDDEEISDENEDGDYEDDDSDESEDSDDSDEENDDE